MNSSFFSKLFTTPTPGGPVQTNSGSAIDIFVTEYNKFDHYEHKKGAISNLLRSFPVNKEFQIGLDYLLQEPDDCNYRLDLFFHFIQTYKCVAPQTYRETVLNLTFLKELLGRTNYLEYLAIILIDFKDQNKSHHIEIMRLFADKIQRMSRETQIKRFYLEDIGRFLEFKKYNDGNIYASVDSLRIGFLKKVIKLLYEGCLQFLSRELDQNFVSFVLLQWLFVLDTITDINDYKLVHQIAVSLSESTRNINNQIVPSKVGTILMRLLGFWTIQFSYKDNFKGYKNLVIAFDLLDSRSVTDCVYKTSYFQEIYNMMCKSRATLITVLHNIVAVNCVKNACLFIKALSENLLFKNDYDFILLIFQEIVCPYLIPKLRVLRCGKEIQDLCEFYFYGLSRVGLSLSENVIQTLYTNISFLFLHIYKKPDLKSYLKEYLDFVSQVCYLYQKSQSDRILFCKLNIMIVKCRKELEYFVKDLDFQKKLKEIDERAWDISYASLKKGGMLSMTDSITQNFRRNNKYKGIKNMGNTCYLACTLQALYRTIDFRVKILQSIEDRFNHSIEDLKSSRIMISSQTDLPDPNRILRGTEEMFFDLLTTEDVSISPLKFKEILPDRFRLANQEQDALEFLQVYFDCLESELKETADKTLVDDWFTGETLNIWECQECFRTRSKKTKFVHIPLNFADKEKPYDDQLKMLKRAFETDSFEEEGSLFCEVCQKKSLLTTQMTEILKLPRFLILSFNRFYFDRGEQRGSKIFTNVEIYQYIDLKDVLKEQVKDPRAQYQLYAIIIHRGFTTEHGHYYTLIRDNEDPNLWILLNDSLSYSLQEGKSLREHLNEYGEDTPYLLFYQQVTSQQKALRF